ncbi:MAG: hypothetical protein ACRDDY_03560 [Clostridium sp.]|uniref:hypothetical protein n=1 Tax=Clostridium sp. TaxID=1506 RepID=UPI003EE6586C
MKKILLGLFMFGQLALAKGIFVGRIVGIGSSGYSGSSHSEFVIMDSDGLFKTISISEVKYEDSFLYKQNATIIGCKVFKVDEEVKVIVDGKNIRNIKYIISDGK